MNRKKTFIITAAVLILAVFPAIAVKCDDEHRFYKSKIGINSTYFVAVPYCYYGCLGDVTYGFKVELFDIDIYRSQTYIDDEYNENSYKSTTITVLGNSVYQKEKLPV